MNKKKPLYPKCTNSHIQNRIEQNKKQIWNKKELCNVYKT